jgi:hypothetical protein
MGVDYPITETLPNIVPLLKLMVSYALIYSFCISTVKISVLFFYLRVFVNERLRLATKIVMGFVASWTITNILLLLLICRPFKANYTPTLSTTHCGNQVQAFISIGAFNIISDVLICALPIPTIWSLTAKRKMKITLSGLFMIGLLFVSHNYRALWTRLLTNHCRVSAIAVGRIVALTHLDLNDITGTMVWVDFLSTTEVSLGILCVSLPMLGPLLRRYQSHRGASRFERTPDEDSSTPSNRRAPKFSGKKQPGSDTLILQSIDGYQDPSYSNFPSANVEISSRDGSEASLNPMAKPEASRTGS